MGARAQVAPAGNALALVVGAFIEALAGAGVRDVCACPGSRSTPLVMLAESHPDLRLWMHLDERSAAYFALGMAKATGCPVALVATSGTAAANFAPAAAEAFYGRVPLIILTADRPPELRDVGAPQTIDHAGLYGGHLKWHVEMPIPEAVSGLADHARITAARCAATALTPPAGPVHVNFPFREPLLPDDLAPWASGAAVRRTLSVSRGRRTPDAESITALSREIAAGSRGVIVCGPQDDLALPPAVIALADRLGWPVLADPLSQARRHTRAQGNLIVDSYDAFLRSPAATARLVPDMILRLGGTPTSKSLGKWLEDNRAAPQLIVDDSPWRDPQHSASRFYQADAATFCSGLAARLHPEKQPLDWLREWQKLQSATRRVLGCALDEEQLSEPAVFIDLATVLPAGSVLLAGNSMPVRDLDTFYPACGAEVRFLANRGANGIDGVVSTALGACASGDRPLVAVLGDLSFYHDMNGLLAARRFGLAMTFIVINNDGGGIFSFLPQAAHREQFELLFGTPHGLEFRHASTLYGLDHMVPTNRLEFRDLVASSIASPGVQVIEVRTNREENFLLHQEIMARVDLAISEMPG